MGRVNRSCDGPIAPRLSGPAPLLHRAAYCEAQRRWRDRPARPREGAGVFPIAGQAAEKGAKTPRFTLDNGRHSVKAARGGGSGEL